MHMTKPKGIHLLHPVSMVGLIIILKEDVIYIAGMDPLSCR